MAEIATITEASESKEADLDLIRLAANTINTLARAIIREAEQLSFLGVGSKLPPDVRGECAETASEDIDNLASLVCVEVANIRRLIDEAAQ